MNIITRRRILAGGSAFMVGLSLTSIKDLLFNRTPFDKRRARSVLDRIQHLGFGACGRCGLTWATVKGHNTPYEWADQRAFKQATIASVESGNAQYWDAESNDPHDMPDYFPSRSMFPLCEECWSELKTPEARMPYYMALVDEWQEESPDEDYENKREQIRHAVLHEGEPPTCFTGNLWLLR